MSFRVSYAPSPPCPADSMLRSLLRDVRGAVTVEAAIALSMLVLFVVAPTTGVVLKLVSLDQLRIAARGAVLRVARADPAPQNQAELDQRVCAALHRERFGTTATVNDCRDLWRWELLAFENPEDITATPVVRRTADAELAGLHNDVILLRIWLARPPPWLDLFADPDYLGQVAHSVTGRLGPPAAVVFARAERAIATP